MSYERRASDGDEMAEPGGSRPAGGEFEASGLSRKEFSEQRGLALGTLDLYRKRRRQSQGAAKPGKLLVEVEVCGSEAAAESSSLLVVLPRGLRIEVGRGFDGAMLELMAIPSARCECAVPEAAIAHTVIMVTIAAAIAPSLRQLENKLTNSQAIRATVLLAWKCAVSFPRNRLRSHLCLCRCKSFRRHLCDSIQLLRVCLAVSVFPRFTRQERQRPQERYTQSRAPSRAAGLLRRSSPDQAPL